MNHLKLPNNIVEKKEKEKIVRNHPKRYNAKYNIS